MRMTKTGNLAALLHVAAQDLRAGAEMLEERLPAVRDAATDAALRAVLDQDMAAATERSAGLPGGGPKNLWMAGVLDDADRDAGSHQPGPVLDIALVGAVRKAKAAEIVSYDTAIALARRLEDTTMAAVLEAGRASSIATDTALRERLAALTHSAASAAAD